MAPWHLLAASLCKTGSASQVTFQDLFLSGNDCHYECLYFTLPPLQKSCSDRDRFRQQWQSTPDPSESHQHPWNSCWVVRLPTSLLREEVEVPPYQSVLQRLQLPLDCLTFFINSQVILFPWQQFPADTKNQVSPWKFKSELGSLSVFICVQLHHHFQEETRV